MKAINQKPGLGIRTATAITLGLLVVAFLGLLAPAASAADPRPNIILILADDFGYECVGADGGTSYRTPVLDQLAATGMRFEHCYVQPLCTPTRVQLMTGIYNVRNYITFGEMDPRSRTFANVLQVAGYATCIAGKWQLGGDPALPKAFGFEEACLWQHLRRPPRYANPGLEINGVEKDYTNGEYGPDLVNDYALDFLTRHKEKPFFLYYPMMLTHAPYQPTPESADWDPKALGEKANQDRKHFADMTAYLDKLIGKVVARVDALGLRRRTLILFVGDNGTGRGTVSQLGKRIVVGAKGSTAAAGMRVPLIANWPGKISAGKVVGNLVDSTDFFPTVCAAAGVPTPAGLDGLSFFPQLCGQPGPPREWVYCWYSPRGEPPEEFAFNQSYKLNRDGSLLKFGYDAGKDPIDPSNLDAVTSGVVKRLQAALDKYKEARPAELPRAAGESKRSNEAD